jgi:sugar lactone lactonase YvrE
VDRAPAPIGSGLHRPECVLATYRGGLYASDSRGGVMHIRPDGNQVLLTGRRTAELSGAIMPNGIALQPDGTFLLAHLGQHDGGVFALRRDGQLAPLLREVDGVALPPTNYVTRDHIGRLWVTVSTRLSPRTADYRPDASTGFIVLDDGRGPRIVADGLGYANECMVTPDGAWLYVNETFTRQLSRFSLRAETLGPKEVVAQFGPGGFPDGLALDSAGAVWVTCVVGDRVMRIDPSGQATAWHATSSPGHVAGAEQAYLAGKLSAEHLTDRLCSSLGGCSSIAFAGPTRTTAVLGSLFNDHLARFDVPVAGAEPPHWRYTKLADRKPSSRLSRSSAPLTPAARAIRFEISKG